MTESIAVDKMRTALEMIGKKITEYLPLSKSGRAVIVLHPEDIQLIREAINAGQGKP